MSIGSERSDPGRVDGNADSVERRAIVEMAADFAAREIAPRVADYDREEVLPTRSARQDGRARPVRRGRTRSSSEGLGLDFVTFAHLIEEVARPARSSARWSRCRPGWSEPASSASAHRSSRSAGCGRWPRARSSAPPAVTEPRSGSDVAGDDDDLPARRRRLRAQRREGVDLEPRHRLVLRHVRDLRSLAAPPWHHRVHHPARHARPDPAPVQEQARVPAAVHGRGRARRRARSAPTPCSGTRATASRRDDRGRTRTPRRRRALGRRRAGVPRRLGRLRAGRGRRSVGRSREFQLVQSKITDMAVGAHDGAPAHRGVRRGARTR